MLALQSDSAAGRLVDSWRIQRRVIWALILREILTRYGRHNIGFLWLFVEPMLFTIGVTALWTATRSLHGSTLPIVAFAITGYSTVMLWRNMPGRCIGALAPNMGLLYHRNVRLIDIYFSRLLLESAGATIAFVTLILAFHFVGWLQLPEDPLQVAGGWLLLAWFGLGFGLTLGSLSEKYEMIEKIWHPLSYLLFPLSGVAFLVTALPPQAQEFVLILPMVHGLEFLREGYFGSEMIARYDIGYMVVCNAVLTLFGLAHTQRVSKSVVLE